MTVKYGTGTGIGGETRGHCAPFCTLMAVALMATQGLPPSMNHNKSVKIYLSEPLTIH